MSEDEKVAPEPTKPQQPAQAEEKALTGSGVMQAVEAVSTIAGGLGGVSGTAYAVKHWNDRPNDAPQASALPPQAASDAEPAKLPAPEPERE